MISASVSTSVRRQSLANRNVTKIAEMPPAQKNQMPATPSRATNPVMLTGVSMEKLVAAMDTPTSHHGSPRPPTKKSSTDRLARRVQSTPNRKTTAR